MPLAVALAYKYRDMSRKLRAQATRAMRREMAGVAREVLTTAKTMITKGGTSTAGSPFKSQRNVTKKLLGMMVGRNNAYVGFRRDQAVIDKRTGRKVNPKRSVPNILEHGSRRMAPRPVLEPALERVKGHPWRSML